jgi:trehalose 6-phosphate synthase/phosphatase
MSSRIPLLDADGLLIDFSSSFRRLLVIDEEDTLWKVTAPYISMENKHLDHIHALLTELCRDPHNLVYLFSGRRRECLDFYRNIPGLGISAENGSFLKFSDRSNWIPMLPEFDISWKKTLLEIFEYYTDRTPGSYVLFFL